MAFKLYLLFLVSFFLHLSSRLPVLGAIRFDLLLLLTILSLIVFWEKQRVTRRGDDPGGTGSILKKLIVFIVISLPLVEWPGTAIGMGATGFIKAVVFYYFTVALVTSEDKLKLIVYVLLACQVFRVLEPLYLNMTQGYWGSVTHLGDGEFADRLSGAPFDVINPNELGYVIIVSIVLLYYLVASHFSVLFKVLGWSLIVICLYALILTASRSAFVVLGVAGLMIFFSSKHKVLLVAVIALGVAISLANMSSFQKDRYLSLFSSETKGAATAQGRMDSLWVDLKVSLNRPVVGHGLGTSKEANYNEAGKGQISHNLYLEVATELGFVGLVIYLLFLKSIIVNLKIMKKKLIKGVNEDDFTGAFTQSLYVWVIVTFVFSFAQYGLSIYAIYFIAGLVVVLQRNYKSADEDEQINKGLKNSVNV